MWKWISRIVVTLAVVLVALRIADRLSRRTGSLPPLPAPNGYATLLTVAHQVSAPSGDVAELSEDAIRQLNETNRHALAELHEALRVESGVPLSTERGWVERHAADVKALKRLAVLLILQSRAAMSDRRTNDAAGSLLDVILLGQALARGGILSDGINAVALETVGTASLRGLAPRLDAALCRSLAQDLERAESRRELPERILNTERTWSAASFGLVSRVGGVVLRKAQAQRESDFTQRDGETTRRTRRLMLFLAARAIELESGQRPLKPADLVPAVLQAVPLDPEQGRPMTDLPAAAEER
jgi:hypothetical protein